MKKQKIKILGKQNCTLKCPICKCENVQKIETGKRVLSAAMLGIFSKKINKSFKCENC